MTPPTSSISAFQDIVLHHSTDAALLLHPSDGVIYASPACEHVTGLPADNFVGMMAADWLHPEDAPAAIAQRRAAEQHGHSGPTLLRARHGDGTYHWFEAEWWHVATNHTVLHIRHAQHQQVAIAYTVSELAALTALLEHGNTVTMTVGASGALRILGGTESLLGWPHGRPVPATWWPIVHPDDQPSFAAMAGGTIPAAICRLSDGADGWKQWSMRAVDLRGDRRVESVAMYATRT